MGGSRKVLFLGLSYYTYTDRIIEALRRKGFEVTYRPAEDRGFWSKTLRKFLPSIYRGRLERYHEQVARAESETRYDYVFFLQIHRYRIEMVERLRRDHPQAKFVLYNWDSLATHDYRPYLGLLDSVFTFDPEDARKIGAHYLPLFALPEYFDAPARGAHRHDIYFVGAIGTVERFTALQRLDRYCRQHGIRFARHLHCSPAIMLMLLRRGLRLPGMSLRSLSTGQIVALMNASTAVFDFPNHRQVGYTMRLIENMCAGKKIVTSNGRVRTEEFYSKQQFFVTEDLNFDGLKEFIAAGVQSGAAAEPQHRGFSLDNWVERIFGG
jgi:hypothetical protein